MISTPFPLLPGPPRPQVLDAMAASGARVTPQAYMSAVSACVAAGELGAARGLVAKLQGAAGAGAARTTLAAPAHMLIMLHDRACDWASALGVLSGLEATGVRADAQVMGALITALWTSGTAAGAVLAQRAFEDACRLGLFR